METSNNTLKRQLIQRYWDQIYFTYRWAKGKFEMFFAVSFHAQEDPENVCRTYATIECAKLLWRECELLYARSIQIFRRLNEELWNIPVKSTKWMAENFYSISQQVCYFRQQLDNLQLQCAISLPSPTGCTSYESLKSIDKNVTQKVEMIWRMVIYSYVVQMFFFLMKVPCLR